MGVKLNSLLSSLAPSSFEEDSSNEKRAAVKTLQTRDHVREQANKPTTTQQSLQASLYRSPFASDRAAAKFQNPMTDKHKRELNGFLKATIAVRRRLHQKPEKEEDKKAQSFESNAYQRREVAKVSHPDQKEKKKEMFRKISRT